MLDRADCADFSCHNSIRLETEHFLNTLALTFISFSGRFVFAMQKHYLFFCERSSSLYMGEATPADPAFSFFRNSFTAIRRIFFHIWRVYAVALGNFSEYAAMTFSPIREVT